MSKNEEERFCRVFICGWAGGLISGDFYSFTWYGIPALAVIAWICLQLGRRWASRVRA